MKTNPNVSLKDIDALADQIGAGLFPEHEINQFKLDIINILYDYELQKLPAFIDLGPLGYQKAAIRAYHLDARFQRCVEALLNLNLKSGIPAASPQPQ